MTTLFLVVEDELSEEVGQKLLRRFLGSEIQIRTLGKSGNGYISSKISNFCQMAQRTPVVIITDLDQIECAPTLMRNWIDSNDIPQNLMLRVAVREVESWLMADRSNFAKFLGISPNRIEANTESIEDPKRYLLSLAIRAKKGVRLDLLPNAGVIAQQGLGYNSALSNFVRENWDINEAASNSDSLNRMVSRLIDFEERNG